MLWTVLAWWRTRDPAGDGARSLPSWLLLKRLTLSVFIADFVVLLLGNWLRAWY
jgi:hypothetical protein